MCASLPLLIRTLVLLDQASTLKTSLNLNFLLKILPPNTVTSKLALQLMNLGGHNSVHPRGDDAEGFDTECSFGTVWDLQSHSSGFVTLGKLFNLSQLQDGNNKSR